MADGSFLHDSVARFSDEQLAALARGVAAANAVHAEPPRDARIAIEDVVSFRCPAFLTADYDPTHKVTRR